MRILRFAAAVNALRMAPPALRAAGGPDRAARGIHAIESIMRWHLLPTLDPKRLDAITTEHVQWLKLALASRAPKTVNNVLTLLSTLLNRVSISFGTRSLRTWR